MFRLEDAFCFLCVQLAVILIIYHNISDKFFLCVRLISCISHRSRFLIPVLQVPSGFNNLFNDGPGFFNGIRVRFDADRPSCATYEGIGTDVIAAVSCAAYLMELQAVPRYRKAAAMKFPVSPGSIEEKDWFTAFGQAF